MSTSNQLTLQKINIIHQHPLFSKFSVDELENLASLFIEQRFSQNKTIVKEGSTVDSIYFIVDGKAEVRQKATDHGVDGNVPIAVLSTGEAIGLGEAGLFSKTGLRTATVVALSEVHTIKLDVNLFLKTISQHKRMSSIMEDRKNVLLSMNLIKKSIPFAQLTSTDMHWLTEQVKPIVFSKGETIFNQGDQNNQCYLICKGKVEIISTDHNGKQSITPLEPYNIFGEVTSAMETTRNTTARTLENCELLTIDKESLLRVAKIESDHQSILMKLLDNGAQPEKIPNIETHFDDAQKTIILKDPKLLNYYRLNDKEWFIWQLLDGKHSLNNISLIFQKNYAISDPKMIASFIIDLEESGLLKKMPI